MLLLLARPVLATLCLRSLPSALIEPVDDAGALPTPASTRATATGRDWRAMLARTIFAWTFTESSMLFLLLLLQATDVSTSQSRAAHFQFSLYALLVVNIILIPQAITLVVFAPASGVASLLRSPRTICFSLISVMLSLALMSYIPFYTDASSPANLLGRSLSRLLVLGTIVLGLLSGFGAVMRAWDFLPASPKHDYDAVPTEEDIQLTEMSLQSTLVDLERKRSEQARRTVPNGDQGTSWMKRVGDTLRGGDDLTLEIRGLQTLHDTLSLSLQSQRSRLASSRASRTFRGRIKSFIGRLFAGYCVFRTFTAAYNTIFLRQRSQQTTTYPDIVTNILVWLLIPPSNQNDSTLLTPELISSMTSHVSLLLIGLIILSSIGLVMRSANHALKVTSKSSGTSLILLVLAYLMAIYLLSTLIQLRSSFPPTSDQTTTNLFTLIPPYELFASLFDLTFLMAAVTTVVLKWIGDRLSMV